MKYLLLSAVLALLSINVSAQRAWIYIPTDSARMIIHSPKTPEEKFFACNSLDRYYYTTGYYDSSRLAQKEMYSIAKSLNKDSLLSFTFCAIGNMLVHKSDYNYALSSYFKALECANSDFTKARAYACISYVYMLTGNNSLGFSYVRKADSLNHFVALTRIINLFQGVVFNNVLNPDSALICLQKSEADFNKYPDPTMISVLLGQFAKSYEIKQDFDLADVYFKKTLAHCKKEKLLSSYIRNANHYCTYLLKRNNFSDARTLALETLTMAKQNASSEGISLVAENLKKIYNHFGNRDSAYYFAEMQITYNDSINNQKTIAEFQNITFAQQLKEIDELTKIKEASELRRQNIQFALIALGIISFIILYLLLSRSFITNSKVIEFFGVIALLIVFEFLNLLLHPFLERITNHSSLLMLLALVCIAALLVPAHHILEKWTKYKLVEKNKAIRLAAAKKTIEQLEK